MSSALSQHVRVALESNPASLASTLADLATVTREIVSSLQPSTSNPSLDLLDDSLHQLFDELSDHSIFQAQIFLVVLEQLIHIRASLIASWFDILLRPALREPNLPEAARIQATDLVFAALCGEAEPSKLRRRIVDLYLLDAFNEGSGQDVLEWAALEPQERKVKASWKANLEAVLLKFGLRMPEDFLTELNIHFATPSARLQLSILLNLYTSLPAFQSESTVRVLASHPLMSSVLNSLLLDTSTTLCTHTLTLLVKLLPIFAVHASPDLKKLLPRFLIILSRILYWRERLPSRFSDQESAQTDLDVESGRSAAPVLQVKDGFQWQVLRQSFDASAMPPNVRRYFTLLYYLFPCNVLRYLRAPVEYLSSIALSGTDLECPYADGWEGSLDEKRIRVVSEPMLKSHIAHPLIIWRDAEEELAQPDFWTEQEFDVEQIATESMMLDVRNASLGIQEQVFEEQASLSRWNDENIVPLSSDVAVDDPLVKISHTATDESHSPVHVNQALAGLQREVLLLRNELNLEVWLSRQNVKHVGRLYHERVLSRDALVERQGLYNKLRTYRSQVAVLDKELGESKANTLAIKQQKEDYNAELQTKLQDFRDQSKALNKEAAALRTAEKMNQALFNEQGKRLSEANQEVAALKTRQKESQHKIDRLDDYERQIQQYIKVQQLFDKDFDSFNLRGKEIQDVRVKLEQMRLRSEALESSAQEQEDSVRLQRQHIRALEAQLSHEKERVAKAAVLSSRREDDIATFAKQSKEYKEQRDEMSDEIAALRDELEEQRAMVEELRARDEAHRDVDPSSTVTN